MCEGNFISFIASVSLCGMFTIAACHSGTSGGDARAAQFRRHEWPGLNGATSRTCSLWPVSSSLTGGRHAPQGQRLHEADQRRYWRHCA